MGSVVICDDKLSLEELAKNILDVDQCVSTFTIRSINSAVTLRNWIIGCYIVEYEQFGSDKAAFGDKIISNLADRLNHKGLGATLLRKARAFYLSYPQIKELFSNHKALSHYLQALISNLAPFLSQSVAAKSSVSLVDLKQSCKKELDCDTKFTTPPEQIITKLSFSHLVLLVSIDDPLIRFFYEHECIRGNWSMRELQRQIRSNLHVRVGLSKDKMQAILATNAHAEKQSNIFTIRDPYTFEFLGLNSKYVVTEGDLEDALIANLQDFLLELGRGFCFEARQKRIVIDGEYYFIDLVFYNRLLHCNVIVELKNDEFRHEHIGQLNAYVSYYAENEMQEGDNPPVGILLCTHKGKKMVEFALAGMKKELFESVYQPKLPSKEELERFIEAQLG